MCPETHPILLLILIRMNKEVFLHIGTNKTGTTSIQNQLYNHRSELLKHGICYPLETKAHHHVFRNNKTGSLQLKMDNWSELMKEIESDELMKVIISSEGFAKSYGNIELDGLHQIKNELRDFDVTIVLFLRSQHSFLESYYSQLLKHGIRFSFNLLQEIIENTNLDYCKMVSAWASVFGKEKLRVLCFDSIDSKDLVKTFYDIVGIPFNPAEEPPANRKPSLDQMRCFYEIHKVISENNLVVNGQRKDLYNGLLRHTKNWAEPIRDYKLMPFEQALSVHRKYLDSNRELIESYTDCGLEKLLEAPEPYDHADISFLALSKHHRIEGIEFIKKHVFPDYSPK